MYFEINTLNKEYDIPEEPDILVFYIILFSFQIENTNISNCSALFGGAIYDKNINFLKIISSRFIKNSVGLGDFGINATTKGGAINFECPGKEIKIKSIRFPL